MPERPDFLAAIRAAPDADAPRLIFADWLDENGRGRPGVVHPLQHRGGGLRPAYSRLGRVAETPRLADW